jgi:hypothetical protein
MRRIAMFVAAGSLVVAVPAVAAKPPHPTHPTHPTHPSHPAGGKKCDVINRGYNARGTFVADSLTAATKKNHFNGSITVNVTRANHGALTGTTQPQMFTLMDARVIFGKGVAAPPATPATTDIVILHGKITALPHGCTSTTFSPTITVKNVTIKAPVA